MLVPYLGATLVVGAGQPYARIEEAIRAAMPGDEIDVMPGEYPQTALRIAKSVRIVAKGQVVLDGKGFDYSGAMPVPRAILEVAADGVTIDGFELRGAHNASHNGAGIRIDAAAKVKVSNCDVYGNDMGVMSNGADDLTVERCHVHHNGDPTDPGFNHNLYLGGESVTLCFCEIDHATTGHDLKSRAHLTRVEYCWLHDAANRELDFVDAKETLRPGSDAIVRGCVIVKSPECRGNRDVIHFGQERGRRVGTLRLDNDTIVTPFAAPVVRLTSLGSGVTMRNCVVANAEQGRPTLVEGGPSSGEANWLSKGYDGAKVGGFTGPSPLLKDLRIEMSAFTRVPTGDPPDYRYAGGGRWTPAKAPFFGAG